MAVGTDGADPEELRDSGSEPDALKERIVTKKLIDHTYCRASQFVEEVLKQHRVTGRLQPSIY